MHILFINYSKLLILNHKTLAFALLFCIKNVSASLCTLCLSGYFIYLLDKNTSFKIHREVIVKL